MKIVNVVWLCKILTKKLGRKHFFEADDEAVYDSASGWICDCGHWTTGEDSYHIPVSKAKRFIYDEGLIK